MRIKNVRAPTVSTRLLPYPLLRGLDCAANSCEVALKVKVLVRASQ
jgi:hypothetical protein